MMNNIAKYAFIALLCGMSSSIFSQNVGINTTGATPSSNAILDLNTGNSNNLGLIVPNVTLGASLATFNPPIAHAATAADKGLMVYNSVATNWPLGYYYWNGSTWLSVASNTGFVWLLTGNSGTTPSTSLIGAAANNNFMGTSDNKDFVFATNNLERMRISSSGNIGIGTKSPTSTLDDSGSYGVGTVKLSPAASSATALTAGYSAVLATPPAVGATYTLTLPSASAAARRIYTVVYYGSGLGTINITSPVSGSVTQNGSVVASYILSQGSVTIQSDGTNWDITNTTTTSSHGSFVGIKYVTASTAGALAFDAGTASILVKVIGGGGAGGGGSTSCAGIGSSGDACGSGGGGGGYVEGFLNNLTGSSTYSVTIGAGGTGNSTCAPATGGAGLTTTLTIVNPTTYTYTANGGSGGVNNMTASSPSYAAGGTGGTATSSAPAGSYITITGSTGASSLISTVNTHEDASGCGAATTFGPGGSALVGRDIAEPGVAALAYGAGGGGGIVAQVASTAEAGGNGANGVVIIYEYQ